MEVSKETRRKEDMRNVNLKEQNKTKSLVLVLGVFFANLHRRTLLLSCNYGPWAYNFIHILTVLVTWIAKIKPLLC